MGGWNSIDRKISGIFWLKYSPSYPRASAKLDLVYLKNFTPGTMFEQVWYFWGEDHDIWTTEDCGGMISISNIWIKMNFTETENCSVTSFNAGWSHRGGILFIKIFFMPWQIFLYQGSSSYYEKPWVEAIDYFIISLTARTWERLGLCLFYVIEKW